MIKDGANEEDIVGFLYDKNIPAEEDYLYQIASSIIKKTPQQGYLTISNALQWRLQYGRIVNLEEEVEGISKLISKNK